MAIADLKNNSPSQNVNISITTPSPDKSVSYPDTDELKTTVNASVENTSTNPYTNLATRDIDTAMQKTEDISKEIDDKDNTIKALTLIIDILQNNPMIKNNYVIAELATLQELIRLLTSSESVEIDCSDIECLCSKSAYRIIKRICITKDDELYDVNQCPALIKLFENYRISLVLTI